MKRPPPAPNPCFSGRTPGETSTSGPKYPLFGPDPGENAHLRPKTPPFRAGPRGKRLPPAQNPCFSGRNPGETPTSGPKTRENGPEPRFSPDTHNMCRRESALQGAVLQIGRDTCNVYWCICGDKQGVHVLCVVMDVPRRGLVGTWGFTHAMCSDRKGRGEG